MIKQINMDIPLHTEADMQQLIKYISFNIGVKANEIIFIDKLRRSIDARSKQIKIRLKADVYINETPLQKTEIAPKYKDVHNSKGILIIGAGPAGLFAALRFIELGLKPIIIERGKNVRERRRDLAALNKEHIVNPDSNYCFGEGGAGTYSDGKLYTRSTKRGDVTKILETLVAHGADGAILVESHPHIGTNKLPAIITDISQTIIKHGGEIHFGTRLTDFIIENNHIKGIVAGEKEFFADNLILATGHSARDVFYLLKKNNVKIEAKPFAMGVRVEHEQSIIDNIQYRSTTRDELLPPAAYSWAEQVNGRGVFSFCMCPGGIIAPCATAAGELVTNGWSPSKRNNPFANSGIVVAIDMFDLKPYEQHDALAGLAFQQEFEKMAFIAGGESQTAPAQRLVDFCEGKLSSTLPISSYQPGITSAPMHQLLHPHFNSRLQTAFKNVGKKMRGYYTNEAVIHGVESRTSSPVKIPRDKNTYEHIEVKGLYPCAEGAGYAGGIISAAIDGQKCAEAIAIKAGLVF
jgi:uncharacterized FAD-dependent dehydrogenase